jgi:glycosyltransferase involved in cell wall biosynthesis
VVTWFPLRFELFPWSLTAAKLPPDVDVVHANSWNAFAFSGCGLPMVTTVHHCVRGIGYPQWKSFPQMLYHDFWATRFERKSLLAADAIVAVSRSTALDLERTYGLKDVAVIENWIDPDCFSPSSTSHLGPANVLVVGNLSRRKGGDLIASFRRSLDPAIHLNIVCGRRGKAYSFTQGLPGTSLLSRVSQSKLIELYRNADVVVCLSRHEGFGYVALEAMACARPVVAFDVPGLRDVVVDGETGLLSQVGDVQRIAEQCLELVNDEGLASRLGRAGRRRVEEHFSPQQALDKYVRLYRSLIEDKSAARHVS